MVYAGSTPGKYWLHNNYTSMNYAFADGHVSLLFVPDTMNGDQPNGTGDINMWRFDQ